MNSVKLPNEVRSCVEELAAKDAIIAELKMQLVEQAREKQRINDNLRTELQTYIMALGKSKSEKKAYCGRLKFLEILCGSFEPKKLSVRKFRFVRYSAATCATIKEEYEPEENSCSLVNCSTEIAETECDSGCQLSSSLFSDAECSSPVPKRQRHSPGADGSKKRIRRHYTHLYSIAVY